MDLRSYSWVAKSVWIKFANVKDYVCFSIYPSSIFSWLVNFQKINIILFIVKPLDTLSFKIVTMPCNGQEALLTVSGSLVSLILFFFNLFILFIFIYMFIYLYYLESKVLTKIERYCDLFLLMVTSCSCCSVTQSCPTLCYPMDCSMPGFCILHCLPEFDQIHVLWVNDAIQPYHPLLPPSPFAFSLSQHQGLLQWVGCSLLWSLSVEFFVVVVTVLFISEISILFFCLSCGIILNSPPDFFWY